MISWRRFPHDSVSGTICTPHQFSIDQAQKHSETALDTPKKEGTEGSFPIKVHLIPGKTPAIYKIFVVQPWCKIQKKNRKSLKIKDLRFVGYPEPGSNRHGLLHWCLRPARLPIPPSGHSALLTQSLRDCFSIACGYVALLLADKACT